jgi:hypothetical protein
MTTLRRTRPLGASEFFEQYVRPCRPVIIEGLFNASGAGAPWSVEYLRQRVGNRRIPVEVPLSRNIFGDPANGGVQYEWTSVTQFLDRVVAKPKGAPRRYLAQLDLAKTFPELLADLPKPACLDYVYCAKTALWIGPGQVTPLHYDMYDNLVYMMEGRKTWTLLSPDDTEKVYARGFPAYYSQVDVEHPDLDQFPAFADATPIVVELCSGDALFVPGGWWHHVRGHGLNIAVNTMWLPPVVPGIATAATR